MKSYRSHKVVRAFKIIDITNGPDCGALLLGEISAVTVDRHYMMRHQPAVGGYYVVYPDGYASFSPAEPFESGYEEI